MKRRIELLLAAFLHKEKKIKTHTGAFGDSRNEVLDGAGCGWFRGGRRKSSGGGHRQRDKIAHLIQIFTYKKKKKS